MRKIKILQFPVADYHGGITRTMLNFWRRMDKERFECDFATMSKTRLVFEDELLDMGSKVHYLSCYAEENEEQFRKEFRNILKQGYDVVHLHTKQWNGFTAEELCMDENVPKVIVHAHNSCVEMVKDIEKYQYYVSRHEEVKKKFNDSLATDFWACSRWAGDFIFGEQIPHDKIKIMPVSIEMEKFCFDSDVRNAYRKKYELENCFVIGHVGRFAYQKNQEFLIRVFNEVLKQVRSARLLLLGDGTLMPEMKALARELDIEKKVIFLGGLDDVCNWWYQAMDVFCLPSRHEGQPGVMVEAQASYLPCVYSDLITSEATINDNVFRIPLEIAAWSNKLVELSEMRSDGERQSHAEDCQRRLRDRGCDISFEVKHLEDEYAKGAV